MNRFVDHGTKLHITHPVSGELFTVPISSYVIDGNTVKATALTPVTFVESKPDPFVGFKTVLTECPNTISEHVAFIWSHEKWLVADKPNVSAVHDYAKFLFSHGAKVRYKQILSLLQQLSGG